MENVRYLTSLSAQIIAGKPSSLNGVLFAADSEPILLASGAREGWLCPRVDAGDRAGGRRR